jgi:predicted Rossmann fold nucleotide-binding protein DprA/Smf involved in DNA uptake
MSDVKEILSDTQAVLLLCGYFGKMAPGSVKPLAAGEYGRLAKWLVERQQRPSDILDMEDADLAAVVEAKLEPSRVRLLLKRGTALALATEKWLRSGLWILSRSDEEYPKHLRKRLGIDAPALLYGAGDPQLLLRGGLAIVGSRNASEAALEFTREVAARCGTEGIAVVSGGARGIDSAAMQAAGEAGGIAIGVLADGLLAAIRNRQNRIGLEAGKLALLSPFYPEAGFNAGNAMARNRCIYALADYALVVQSDLNKGGTWAGATENLREGWVPVFVRSDPSAPGNAELIRKGARPFDYDFRAREPLRAWLDGRLDDREPAELFAPKPAVEEQTAKYEAPTMVSPPPIKEHSAELDLYGEFVRRLVVIVRDKPLSQKDIGKSLGLEPAQAKVWLKRAVDDGAVEAKGKTKRYAPSQRRLFE